MENSKKYVNLATLAGATCATYANQYHYDHVNYQQVLIYEYLQYML